jgi:hypothetical protein
MLDWMDPILATWTLAGFIVGWVRTKQRKADFATRHFNMLVPITSSIRINIHRGLRGPEQILQRCPSLATHTIHRPSCPVKSSLLVSTSNSQRRTIPVFPCTLATTLTATSQREVSQGRLQQKLPNVLNLRRLLFLLQLAAPFQSLT